MTGAERTGDNGSTRCVLLLRRCRPCLCGNGTLRFTSGGGGEKRKVIAGLYVHGPRLIALMTFTRRTAPDAIYAATELLYVVSFATPIRG